MAKTATTKSTTARKSATRRTAPKVQEAPAKDFSYLVEKDPSSLHEDFAAFISAELGVEMDPKHVQYVLGMHHSYQKGARNKSRADYRPLHATIVAQRSVHMTQAHVDARAERAQAEQAAQAKRDAAKARRAAAKSAK